jgi:deaminated glutathione amidase
MYNNKFLAVILFYGLVNVFVFPEVNAQNNTGQGGKVVIASCQFPVSSHISENYEWIKTQIIEAKLKKADIVHFPECALTGYPGKDITLDNFDWKLLNEKTDSVLNLAKQLKIWVVLGSIHKLSDGVKPHNSLYVINSEGEIVDRYDKRFLTKVDLKNFSPGNHFVNFDLNGVNCGLLICYDICFPELYREYRKLNTDLIFHSFYNAHKKIGDIHPIIMPIISQARAATNNFYISLTNSSAAESWPCHLITPDGLIQNKLATNIPGILISTVDLSNKYNDSGARDRENAINGILHNGTVIQDPKSQVRNKIEK